MYTEYTSVRSQKLQAVQYLIHLFYLYRYKFKLEENYIFI